MPVNKQSLQAVIDRLNPQPASYKEALTKKPSQSVSYLSQAPKTNVLQSVVSALNPFSAENRAKSELTKQAIKNSSSGGIKSLSSDERQALFDFSFNIGMVGTAPVNKVTKPIKSAVKEVAETILPKSKSIIGKVGQEIKPANTIIKETDKIINNIKLNLDKISDPQMKVDATKKVVTTAIDDIVANADNPAMKDLVNDKSQRLFKKIGGYLNSSDISPDSVARLVKDYNIPPQEMADYLIKSTSEAGKTLNVWSNAAKKLAAAFPDDVVINQTLNKPLSAFDYIWEKFRKLEQIRRGLLVTQLGTSARNIISQSGRYGIQIFDDILTGMGEAVTGKANVKNAFAPAMEDFLAIAGRFNKSQRQNVENILRQFPVEREKLLGNVVAETGMPAKAVKFLNTLNTTQEYFFRKMAFDARINSSLERAGLSQPTQEMIEDAVNHSLELTFAKNPKGFLVNEGFYKALNSPIITALGNPFPRFWTNSLKFLWDFNPTGFSKLFSKEFRKQLTSSNPREAYSALAKASIGTTLLGAGMAIRNSEFAGDKWYQIKMPNGKILDARPYAPLSTYLFLGEAAKGDDSTLNGMDWLQGAISINRISGTGLAVVDLVRSSDPKQTIKLIKQILGTYVGGFTVPFRTIKDFIGQVDPSQRQYSDAREAPFLSPVLGNIPYADTALPRSYNITRGTPTEKENPMLRQISGFSVTNPTYIERELSRLQIPSSELYPKTGDTELDRKITEKTGLEIAKIGELLEKNKDAWDKVDDIEKEKILKDLFSEIKSKNKKEILASDASNYATKIWEEIKKSDDKAKTLEKYKNKGFLSDDVMMALSDLIQKEANQ